MTDTLDRQWLMLRMIPRAPRKITVSELQRKLADSDFRVPVRTIQRDLIKLSGTFPLKDDSRSKPYGWSWIKDAPALDVPGMDPQTALTFKLTEMFLSGVMPPAVRQNLEPQFKNAREVLKKRLLRQWAERVRVIRSRQTLKTPSIKPGVMQTVYDALLQHQRIAVHYLKPGGEPADYEVNPLGIVFRDEVGYLVCTLFDYADVRQLALHRIQKANITDKAMIESKNFDLDAYIRAGNFDWRIGEQIKLVAEFDTAIAALLQETPLSDDQVISKLDNETSLVKATVLDTAQLRWWLLGFGDSVEVLKPISLRREFVGVARNLSQYYKI